MNKVRSLALLLGPSATWSRSSRLRMELPVSKENTSAADFSRSRHIHINASGPKLRFEIAFLRWSSNCSSAPFSRRYLAISVTPREPTSSNTVRSFSIQASPKASGKLWNTLRCVAADRPLRFSTSRSSSVVSTSAKRMSLSASSILSNSAMISSRATRNSSTRLKCNLRPLAHKALISSMRLVRADWSSLKTEMFLRIFSSALTFTLGSRFSVKSAMSISAGLADSLRNTMGSVRLLGTEKTWLSRMAFLALSHHFL